MRSFVKIKSSRIGEISLLFTEKGKQYPSLKFNAVSRSFNTFRENKILAKIYDFTASGSYWKFHKYMILYYLPIAQGTVNQTF